ncbi:MAG: hypothetical protein SCH68_09080 [Brevefilum sp.]|nr:hypothetical protein [Brevefilum sp.]
MNQIAIGASSNFIVLEGQSAAAPFYHAVPCFSISPEPILSEKIEITLRGMPSQISTAVASLEKLIDKAGLYDQKAAPSPLYLRFQLEPAGPYYSAEISNLSLISHPAGYKTHARGSLVLELHYTRPNYFDGPQVEVPLCGRFGEDVLAGVTLYNHTDYHSAHGNSVYIKPASLTSPLPAPLRIELENTCTTGAIKDIYVGMGHHQGNYDESPFFHNAPDFSGGDLLLNTNAINDYFRRLTWSGTSWSQVAAISLSLDMVDLLGGKTYRPLLHLFNPHAYEDLYLAFKLQRGSSVIYASEPVYADPQYGYVFLPPVDLPPNQLLRETPPHSMDFVLYAYSPSTGTKTLDVDQVQLFPQSFGANFLGFFNMLENDILIDDSSRGLSNVRYSIIGSEMVAHIRQGGPLFGRSNEYNRIIFAIANATNNMDIMRTAALRVYQRERRRIL